MILSKQISEENKYGRKDRHDEKTNAFCKKNRHKTQRKAKFYLNNWRSVFYMQGGLKQTLA